MSTLTMNAPIVEARPVTGLPLARPDAVTASGEHLWHDLRHFLRFGGDHEIVPAPRMISVDDGTSVRAAIHADPLRVVAEVLAASAGETLRDEPAMLALVLAASCPDELVRRAALIALPRVARTSRQLFLFATYVRGHRGWGRGLRRAVGAWYNERPVADLVDLVLSCEAFAGWRHADLLRLGHPKATTPDHDAAFRWITAGVLPATAASTDEPLARLRAVSRLRDGVLAAEAAALVRECRLPLAAIPDRYLRDSGVWNALAADESVPTLLGAIERLAVSRQRPSLETLASRIAADRTCDPIVLLRALRHVEGGPMLAGLAGPLRDALDRRELIRPLAGHVSLRVSSSVAAAPGELADLAAVLATSLVRAQEDVSIMVIGATARTVAVPPWQSLDEVRETLRRAAEGSGVPTGEHAGGLRVSEAASSRSVVFGLPGATAGMANEITVSGIGPGVLGAVDAWLHREPS